METGPTGAGAGRDAGSGAGRAARLGQSLARQGQRDEGEGQVDEKDPSPAQCRQHRGSQRRAKNRGQLPRDGDEAHRTAKTLRARRLRQDRLNEREDQAPAGALDDALWRSVLEDDWYPMANP